MAARTNRTEKLDLRLTAQAKRALQSAAKATHKTLGDFGSKARLPARTVCWPTGKYSG